MPKLIPHHLFLGGLGNFTPSTFSIFTIIAPLGTDFPASHEFTSDLGIWISFENWSWFHPLAFLAWAIAIRKSWGIEGAILIYNATLIVIFWIHYLSNFSTVELLFVGVLMLGIDFFFKFGWLWLLWSMLEWTREDCITLGLHLKVVWVIKNDNKSSRNLEYIMQFNGMVNKSNKISFSHGNLG